MPEQDEQVLVDVVHVRQLEVQVLHTEPYEAYPVGHVVLQVLSGLREKVETHAKQ